MTDAAGQPAEFARRRRHRRPPIPRRKPACKGPGSYRLRLSNCDHEMLLWVNGSRRRRSTGRRRIDSDDLIVPAYSAADPGDLAPAGIGSRGAAVQAHRSLRDLSRQVLHRRRTAATANNDYRSPSPASTPSKRSSEIFRRPDAVGQPADLFAAGQSPARRVSRWRQISSCRWATTARKAPTPATGSTARTMPHHYVERDLLIGKALLIYWPHTWNRPIPFTPNFSRMGPIR